MLNEKKTIEEMILAHLKESGKSVNWLSKELAVTQHHLTKVLRPPDHGTEKRNLSVALKSKIEQILGQKFTLTNP